MVGIVSLHPPYAFTYHLHMPNYRRLYYPGGMYFFTINLQDRSKTLLIDHIDFLREAITESRNNLKYHIAAMVVLPEHLHLIMALPPGGLDFSNRIRLLKSGFSRRLPAHDPVSQSHLSKGERGIWQRRFWEHLIRDEEDLENHINYIHFNPVKHGYVTKPTDWPYSSIHRFIEKGWRPSDWGNQGFESDLDLD